MLAPQTYRLADTQTVAINHQHQQVIAHAMAPAACGSKQPLDLTFVEEVFDPFMGVGGGRFLPTLNITRFGSYLGPLKTLVPV